jgi:hypothetical protein
MIEIFNQVGQVDLSQIDPAEVAQLNDEQQAALAFVIETVQTREKAEQRFKAAQERVRELMRAEVDALEVNRIANPPPSFIDTLRAAQAAYTQSQQ